MAAVATILATITMSKASDPSTKESSEKLVSILKHFPGLSFSAPRLSNEKLTDLVAPALELIKRHPEAYQFVTTVLQEGAIEVQFCPYHNLPSAAMWKSKDRIIQIREDDNQDKFALLDALIFEFCNAGNKEGAKILEEKGKVTAQNYNMYGEQDISESILLQHAELFATYDERAECFTGNRAARLQQTGVSLYGWHVPSEDCPRVVRDEKTWLEDTRLTTLHHGGFSHFDGYMNLYFQKTLAEMNLRIEKWQKLQEQALNLATKMKEELISIQIQFHSLKLKGNLQEITWLQEKTTPETDATTATQIQKYQQDNDVLKIKIDKLKAGEIEDPTVQQAFTNNRTAEIRLNRYKTVKTLLEKIIKVRNENAKPEMESLKQFAELQKNENFNKQKDEFYAINKRMQATLLAISQSAPQAVRTEAQQKDCVEYQNRVLALFKTLNEILDSCAKNALTKGYARPLTQLNKLQLEINTLELSMNALNKEIREYRKDPGLLTWAFSYCCCCFKDKPQNSRVTNAEAAEPVSLAKKTH